MAWSGWDTEVCEDFFFGRRDQGAIDEFDGFDESFAHSVFAGCEGESGDLRIYGKRYDMEVGVRDRALGWRWEGSYRGGQGGGVRQSRSLKDRYKARHEPRHQ